MFSDLLMALQAVGVVAPPPPDVVVTGERPPTRRELRDRVEDILPPLSFEQPLARFTDAVCPGVMGLTRPTAQAIVDRIGEIADDVGLAVGEPGCRPNLLVLIVPDSQATVRRLVGRAPGSLATQSLADVRRIVAEPGTARAWIEADTRSRDGMRTYLHESGYRVLPGMNPSRAALSIRRDIVTAYVVIDADSIAGRDTRQIADYAAMRGLSDARPGRIGTAGRIEMGESILTAFLPGGDRQAPTTLTALDRGVLRGLYSGQGNRSAVSMSGTIVSTILDAPAKESGR